MSLRQFKTIDNRRKTLEKTVGLNLEEFTYYPPDLSVAQTRNCENMVGAISVPLGIAGPLKIKRDNSSKDYYLPLSTTEGALIASVNRGCKIITLSGGASVISENKGITRGSVFKTNGILESYKLSHWLQNNLLKMEKVAAATSSHLKLTAIFSRFIDDKVYSRFSFDTMDAMGMNMATLAAEKIASFITRKTGWRCLAIASNYDTDKKPSYLNFILGRGWSVWAEVRLNNQLIKEILKTTPQKIHSVNEAKNLQGSIMSGSLGFNAHFANVVAAIYLATGQDIAHVSEGSLGITSTKIKDKQLSVSVYLPDLPLGTVGGGTSLPAQKKALALLGIAGGDSGKHAAELAEIIGVACLAGEISLLAAISTGTLGSAHQKLGRAKRDFSNRL